MADHLQEELHDSLTEQKSRRGAAKKVRAAIFPNASQLDPDLLSEMTLCIRRWLEAYNKNLSRLLRVGCAFRAVESEVVSHTQLPTGTSVSFWGILAGLPSHRILMTFPREFSVCVCERVFGAPFGASPDRPLTGIELRVMSDLAAGWMKLLDQAWAGAKFVLDEKASEPRRQESVSAHWLMFKTDLTCGDVSGEVRLYMGGATARRLLGSAGHGGPDDQEVRGLDGLGQVHLEAQAILGRAQFTLDELMSLSVGDIVTLDRRSYEPIELVIDGRTAFCAQASLSGQMVALELIRSSYQENKL